MNAIKPVAENADSVTLRRTDFDALLDAADGEHARSVEAAARRGETEYLPVAMVRRMARGERPVRVWREHRGLTQAALAASAGISKTYLSEIESRRKPGSVAAMTALARALRVRIEDLVD
jgi:DNA-binding XRE family transcriptional regulator